MSSKERSIQASNLITLVRPFLQNHNITKTIMQICSTYGLIFKISSIQINSVFCNQRLNIILSSVGASSLHLAIAYSNNELVQDLVEAGADVNQRAIGKIQSLFTSVGTLFHFYIFVSTRILYFTALVCKWFCCKKFCNVSLTFFG